VKALMQETADLKPWPHFPFQQKFFIELKQVKEFKSLELQRLRAWDSPNSDN